MTKEEIKKEILYYLSTQNLMSISTQGEPPWPAVLYYVNDDDLNLYFISPPNSKHCLNIKDDPIVTISIYDSSTTVEQLKLGLQIVGEAEEVSMLKQVKWMVKMWNKQIATPSKGKFSVEDLRDKGGSRVFKIKPRVIQYFNKTLVDGKPFVTLDL